MTQENKCIEVEHLSFSYGDDILLEDIDFAMDQGEILGLVGPNGSGKSTLIKLLLHSIKATQGSIRLLGKDIDDFKDWEKIGYIAQSYDDINKAFPASVTEVVRANLYKSVGLFKPFGRKEKERTEEALALTGVAHLRHRHIGDLSGGEKQRVFLARALVSRPKLLILDEATSAVDQYQQKQFYELLEKLNHTYGISILMVSHDLATVNRMADRLLCLADRDFFIKDTGTNLDRKFLEQLFGFAWEDL